MVKVFYCHNNFHCRLRMHKNQNYESKHKDELLEMAVDLKISELKGKQQYRFGHWTEKENLKHYLFIYHHQEKFLSKNLRKSLRVFKLMSEFMKTRNAAQCRTHHQKIVSREQSFQKCLELYISEHPSFLEQYERVKSTLQILEEYDFCQDKNLKRISGFQNDQEIKRRELINLYNVKIEEEDNEENTEKENVVQTMMHYSHEQTGDPQLRQQWASCHQLFITWVTKVQQLIKISPPPF